MPLHASVANENTTFHQEINGGFTETDSRYLYRHNTLTTSQRNNALYSTSLRYEQRDIYEDMALGDEFLGEYYSQVLK